MTDKHNHGEFSGIDPSRRTFMRRFAATAFITPLVASFALDGVASADARYHGRHQHGNQYMQNQPNQYCGNQSIGNQWYGNQHDHGKGQHGEHGKGQHGEHGRHHEHGMQADDYGCDPGHQHHGTP